MAGLLTDRIEISFRGEPVQLVATHAVLLEIERRMGIDVLSGALGSARLRLSSIRTLLHIFIQRVRPDVTAADVGRLLGNAKKIAEAKDLITRALLASMPERRDKPDADRDDGDGDGDVKDESEPPISASLRWDTLWSEAHYNLHLSFPEWLHSTPRMIQALNDRRLEDIHWIELMIGQVAANAGNFGYARPRTPFKAEDFLLHRRPDSYYPVERDGYMSGDAMFAVLHSSASGIQFKKGDTK